MPRPVSWLPRLREIRRSVDNSVRSHYTRAELQRLFQLQPRAAGKLIALLPTTVMNGSYLVAREDLVAFLERVRKADDVPELLREVRREISRPSQKKVRRLVLRDVEPVSLDLLPPGLRMARGEAHIRFETLESLVDSLGRLAQMLTDELEEFALRWEPVQDEPDEEAARQEMRKMFEALRRMEEARFADTLK